MNKIFAGIDVGRKNIVFGVVLFLVLGVVVGVPLTVDLFGGSLLTESQYQTWKVLHGYGVFLAFVNFFFGYLIDRLSISEQQKEIASWSFVIAGLVGGIGRPVLFLLSSPGGIARYAVSLIETVGVVLGTHIFVRGQMMESSAQKPKETGRPASELPAADDCRGWTWEGWAQMMKSMEANGVNVNECINFMKGKTDEYLNHLRPS